MKLIRGRMVPRLKSPFESSAGGELTAQDSAAAGSSLAFAFCSCWYL